MSTTREEARSKIQRRIGDIASSTFYTTAFYNDIIDSRVLSIAGILARHMPNYYLEHYAFTGVDDAADSTYEFYSLPTNYKEFVKLERQHGTGNSALFETVPRVNAEEQDRYKVANRLILTLPDSLTNYEMTVSVWDTQVRLIPAPQNNSYEFRLKYLRRPTAATGDSSNLDMPDEYIELLVLESSVYILNQIGNPMAQNFMLLRDQELFRIQKESGRKTLSIDGIPPLTYF